MKVLLVEDEVAYREALRDMLNIDGFVTDAVGSIASGEHWLKTHDCDVVLIDRVLPDGDGLKLLASPLLNDQVVKIMLTARGQSHDRILGLNADADYYLIKPVNYDELLALLNRLQRKKLKEQPHHETWQLDRISARLVSPNQMTITLTRREVSALSVFVNRSGIAVPRTDFIVALNEDPAVYDPRRLEVLLRRLRDKVETQTSHELPITSVYGVGYSFNASLTL